MKLGRPIRIFAGLALSGGVIGLLSGSALAAEGPVTTTEKAQVVQKTETDVTLDNSQTVVTEGVVSVDEAQEGMSTGKPVAVQVEPVPSESDSPVKAQTAVAEIKNPVVTQREAVPAGVPEQTLSQKAVPVVSAVEAVGPSVAVVMPSLATEGQAKALLPMQPLITNRPPAPVQDLATAMPSAEIPADQPAPAESNGLLGRLAAELSSMTLPQLPVLAGFQAMVVLLGLLAGLGSAKLWLGMRTSYGMWLHRGGMATAARSDLPVLAGYFAMLYGLGYVQALTSRHNSFLIVATSGNRIS